MNTGELKSKTDSVWDAFWSGGMSNPLEGIAEVFHQIKQAAVPEDVA